MKKKRRRKPHLLIFIGLVLLICFVYHEIMNIAYPLHYGQLVEKYSQEYELDTYLVFGVIKAESNFVKDAHSGKARGLMQITDDTAVWLAKRLEMEGFSADDIEKPAVNIKMGCCYLRYLLDLYGDTELALAAYNAGPGNVNKWLASEEHSADGERLDNIPFKETREYVKKVEKYTELYRKRYKQ